MYKYRRVKQKCGATYEKLLGWRNKRISKSILCMKREWKEDIMDLSEVKSVGKSVGSGERRENGAKIAVAQYSLMVYYFAYGQRCQDFKLFFVLFANVLIRITSNWFYVKCSRSNILSECVCVWCCMRRQRVLFAIQTIASRQLEKGPAHKRNRWERKKRNSNNTKRELIWIDT